MPLNKRKIRSLMRGRRQVDVAEAAGMKQPNLWKMLNAKKADPRLSTIERLAKALGCGARDLLK